ncbi:MAG: STAS domain-containing protein [Frankiaceae bacterium]|nr:STAS domain-containing protein [Arenimonas sp.]
MSLEIQIKRDLDLARQHIATVELTGSLDTATAPELERGLMPLIDAQLRHLVFDLAGLKFISSAGLRVFGIARKRMNESGGQLAFVNMQPQIEEVFEIIKALPGLDVFRNMAEMDSYLSARQLRDRDED